MLMKQVKITGNLLGCLISIIWIVCCTHDMEPKPDSIVIITTDKTTIKANNKDKVFFSVTVGGNDITSSVVITEKNQNIPLEGVSFSTDSVASYTFFTTYNNVKSNEVIIEVIDIEVIISVDRQTIKANDKDIAVFSVVADDEDVTSAATIIQVESLEEIVVGDGFFTKIPGTYTFYATYNEKKSNEIRINASAVEVSLSVDNTSIIANNRDKSTFIVKYDEENVTSSAVIMQRTVNNNFVTLDNQEFFTDKADTYTFFATYEGMRSNDVTIEAEFVELAFLKGYSIVEITSTTCPVCPLLTAELDKLKLYFPDRIHVISLHPFGKYCDSDLSGALAETAVRFVDNVNPLDYHNFAPPLAIVDLYDPVHLYERDTQTPLIKAIDRATLTRERASMTGMAVQSSVNGSKINFKVSFKTIKTGNYRFFAFIVEDNVVNRQALGEHMVNPDFINHNVGTYLLTEGDPYQGVNLGIITVDSETTRAFSINTDNFRPGRIVDLANCRIVCYTLRSINGKDFFVDNVTSCPVNGTVRYLYE